MKKITSLAILSVLAACQSPAELPLAAVVVAPKSADEALEPYYRSLPEDFYPRAPAGLALPDAGTPLTRILVGSCLDEEKPGSASLRSVAAESADRRLALATSSATTTAEHRRARFAKATLRAHSPRLRVT